MFLSQGAWMALWGQGISHHPGVGKPAAGISHACHHQIWGHTEEGSWEGVGIAQWWHWTQDEDWNGMSIVES